MLIVKRLLNELVGVTVAEVRVSDSIIQEASIKHCCKQWCGHPGSSEFTMGESNNLKDQIFERFALSRICTANLNLKGQRSNAEWI